MGIFDLSADQIARIDDTLSRCPNLNVLLPHGVPAHITASRSRPQQAAQGGVSGDPYKGGNTDHWSGSAKHYASDRDGGNNYGTASDNSGSYSSSGDNGDYGGGWGGGGNGD